MTNGPTTADLIALAAERGISVTSRQVERWRYERLIGGNAPRGLGRGAGTRWTYGEDGEARFLAAAQLVVVERCTIAEAAVRLWIVGFAMEAKVLRRHLHRAAASLRAVRARLARWDAEEAGNAFIDGLRRHPDKRAQYGVRAWTDAERDGAAAFVENVVESYLHPERGLDADTVRRTKTFIGMTPEDDARLAAAGNDMNALVQSASAIIPQLAGIADDATDQELQAGRALCAYVLSNAEAMRELLALEGASGPFVAKALAPIGGTFGLLIALSAVRYGRALAGGAASA